MGQGGGGEIGAERKFYEELFGGGKCRIRGWGRESECSC